MARKKKAGTGELTARELRIARRTAKKAEIAARRNARAILDLQVKREALLDQIRQDKLIAAELATRLVARTCPQGLVFINCYDFALPSGDCIPGRPVCVFGPWIRPAFVKRNYYKKGQGRLITPTGEDLPTGIVRTVLQGVKAALDAVAQSHSNLRIVPTQGTLGAVKARWANEMHPKDPGFRSIAKVFHDTIKAQGGAFASI